MNIKSVLCALVVGCGALVSANAFADNEYHPNVQTGEGNKFKAGVGFDVGTDGAALGLVVSPFIPAIRLEGAFTYDYVGEGLRGSASWDMFRFPISPILRADVGGYFPFSVPGMNNSPTFSYTYENLLGGIGFGKRSGFRFFFMGGTTHIDLNASGFGKSFTLPQGTSLGNTANVDGWIPSGKLGFDWLF